MKKLEINITKATLQSFNISAKEGKPEVSVTLALLTEGGKAITSYTVMTDAWSDKDKLDLPVSVLPLIGELARILERAAVNHCRDSQLALPAPKQRDDYVSNNPDDNDSVVPANLDEPINLDDIKF